MQIISGARYFPVVPGNVEPSNYALELVSPREAGTAPSAESGTPNFPSGHRIFKAYPGLEYNIKAVTLGGSYPYSYALSGGVSWLSVDANTGVVSGTAPSVANGTTYTPTLTVTDAEGTSIAEPWTITVTTVGFKFVDSVNDGTGDDGSLAAPYDTFAQMKTSTSAGDIVYFREGAYDTGSITPDSTGGATGFNNPNGNWQRLEISGSARSVQWIAYPGETPTIDGGYVASTTQGNLIRVSGTTTYPMYIDGLEFTNYYHMAIQVGGAENYGVVRRTDINGIANSFDGANSAAIDSLSLVGSAPRYYMAYQDNSIHDNKPGPIKVYWQYKSLMEGNSFVDNGGIGAESGADASAAGPDHKAVPGRFEVRANTFANCPSSGDVADANGATADSGFGGNMNAGNDADVPGAYAVQQASGEVRFNKFGCASRPGLRVVNMNNFSNAGEIFIYRNTGIGRWNVENSDTGTGPFHFYDNVIINDVGSADPDRITVSSGSRTLIVLGSGDDVNLAYSTTTGASVVDSSLNLIGTYRTDYLGLKGAELQ